ncbi:methyl-accepting chemotaxis protein [Sedimentibacter sp.]|uniref:methyl-accepting chemotaxis protein n=1 Tax=Sedimentibacter sp. TaxID=1960295 RepID=UPI00289FB317|nr:methyl-accepting chemotaxis protein [Sedimentibacter sp.]
MKKWYLNLNIRSKLIIGFSTVAMITLIVGIIGIININGLVKQYSELFNVYGAPLRDISDAEVSYHDIRINLQKAILEGTKGKNNDVDSYKLIIEEEREHMYNSLKIFENTLQTEEGRTEFNKLIDLLNQYNTELSLIAQYANDNKIDAAIELSNGKADELSESIEEVFENLQHLKVFYGNELSAQLTDETKITIISMIIIIIISILIAIACGFFNSSIISKPISRMVDAAEALATGDVNVNIEIDRSDEVGKLAASFDKMIENIRSQAFVVEKIASGDFTVDISAKSDKDLLGNNLKKLISVNNDVLHNILNASNQVTSGSEQVASASQMLSQSSTEQASSVEEISATIEEVAAQIKQNSDFANQAIEVLELASENLIYTNEQMNNVVNAMNEISVSSEKMSRIIKVIDDISFQTNILALNAAVEAAHAGQYGKGFAVVAEEVRNLAAKSNEAAKDTTELIETSISKAENGKTIVNATYKALEQVKEAGEKTSEYVSSIAAASNEQNIAMNQITEAIMQISQAVQTNSATAEESAAASEELSSQAILLKGLVSKFKIKSENNLAEEVI